MKNPSVLWSLFKLFAMDFIKVLNFIMEVQHICEYTMLNSKLPVYALLKIVHGKIGLILLNNNKIRKNIYFCILETTMW